MYPEDPMDAHLATMTGITQSEVRLAGDRGASKSCAKDLDAHIQHLGCEMFDPVAAKP